MIDSRLAGATTYYRGSKVSRGGVVLSFGSYGFEMIKVILKELSINGKMT